jgi:hypothetical protein
MYRIDRRVWASVLFRTTTPDIIEGVIVKRSERLHWPREAAMEETQGWADELTNSRPASPIIFYDRRATCWNPQVKGLTLMVNSLFNGWRMEDVWLDQ